MGTPQISIGTAGWSYKDWVGVFYPPASKQADWLSYYARFFNCIEVNSTFYAPVRSQAVKGWIEKTEFRDDFTFILKLHQLFTHHRQRNVKEMELFKKNLDLLQDQNRLKGVLVQFPYSFDFNQANAQYLNSLLQDLEGYSRFVELRHDSWQNDEILRSICDAGSHCCVIDQPRLGHSSKFIISVFSGNLYLRLHGRNAKAWAESVSRHGASQSYDEQNERYNYLYSRGELLEIVVRVREAIEKLQEVIIIANNHPHGNAVINAIELMEFLRTKIGEGIPQTTKIQMQKLQRL